MSLFRLLQQSNNYQKVQSKEIKEKSTFRENKKPIDMKDHKK